MSKGEDFMYSKTKDDTKGEEREIRGKRKNE